MTRKILLAGLILLLLIAIPLSIDGIYLDRHPDDLKSKYTSSESKFINVNGMNVHYRDQGQGPTLLLLHGVNASLHTWEGWVESLSSDFRVISLDLPGHGLTGPDPNEQYSWQQTAAFVVAFANQLKLDKFHLAGNSRGGAVAWQLALFYPHRVNKMILLDAAGIPWEDPLPLPLKMQLMPVSKHISTVLTPKWLVRQSVDSVYGDPDKITPEIYDRYHSLLLRKGNRRASSQVLAQTFDQEWFHSRLPEIQHPTLILWGTEDQWIQLKYGQRMHKLLPNSKMITYAGVGHIPMEEIPQQTALDAKRFLL